MEGLEWSISWWTPYTFPSENDNNTICECSYHSAHSRKSSLWKSKYTFVYPNKDDEVINSQLQHHYNSTSPRFSEIRYSDPREEVHMIKYIPYTLVPPTRDTRGLVYI